MKAKIHVFVDSAACVNCREQYSFAQLAERSGRCLRCGGETFDCRIIRKASGLDVGCAVEALASTAPDSAAAASCSIAGVLLLFVLGPAAGELLSLALGDGPNLFYKLETVLDLPSVFGKEIIEFEKMSDTGKRSFIISKKRAEIERCLPEDFAFCKRCDVIFKKYDND